MRIYLFCVALLVGGALTLPSFAQSQNRPSALLNYAGPQEDVEGDGYMVAGDLWDTVMPLNTAQPGLLGNRYQGVAGQNLLAFMHLGSEDAAFFNPGGMWPNAYRVVNLFRNARKFGFTAFDKDGWPNYAAGNPIFNADQGKDPRFMIAMYGPKVAGANDANRNYKREARYVDAARTHMIYEAGWPTTIGVDFKLRAHQYTSNEQNLNDFIVLEWTLTNTGMPDTDANGTPDATGHVVEAIVGSMQAETAPAIKIGFGGDRTRGPDGGSKFGAGRTYGYVGAPDENGHPHDFVAFFANVPPTTTANRAVPPAGSRDFGINNYTNKDGYTDVWGAFRWMGVKQGSIGDAISGSSVNPGALSNVTANSPDKQTIFGTHPIGVGPQKGWYVSHVIKSPLVTYRWQDAVKEFRAATAVWYEDYGRTSNGSTTPNNLNPNSRFFSGGTAGDVTSFVPRANPQRPNGDYKYGPAAEITPGSGIEQPIWEEGWNPALRGNNSPSAADFYNAVGYALEWNFDNSNKNGVGPFRLEVGESITFVWAGSAGYRFEGVEDALDAAEWVWEKGFRIQNDLPTPPAPEMRVVGSEDGFSKVEWTDVSNLDSEVDGYKIWRATQYRRFKYEEDGMRVADRFHHQHEVGGSRDGLRDPVNRFYDFNIETTPQKGVYQPEEWGTYELVKKIPKGELGQFAASGSPYDYAWEDESSILGFTYWYYVSAYKDKEGATWRGPQGPVTAGHLESSGVVNRNGRNTTDAPPGTVGAGSPWFGTYPFAWNHALFPKEGTLAHKNMGAAFTLKPALAPVDRVKDLITVTPNPYKITGLNDVRNVATSHTINFLGVPSDFTLTILDVSGQIIFQQQVTGGSAGQFAWNMFSKDGVEVASGLYVYHISYGDGQEAFGHFAILR